MTPGGNTIPGEDTTPDLGLMLAAMTDLLADLTRDPDVLRAAHRVRALALLAVLRRYARTTL